jgi:hypothetical protein
MRKCGLLIIVPITLLLACGRTDERSHDNKDTSIDSGGVPKSEVITKIETKGVASICSFIDNLYGNLKHPTIDTLAHSQDLNVTDRTSQFISILGQKIQGHFRCGSFDFFVLNDNEIASTQFSELIKLSDTGLYTEDPERMYDIFPKGGSTIILFNEIIIRHIRACNFDEAIEAPREIALVDFLFGEMTPDSGYFLRIKCGGNVEIK